MESNEASRRKESKNGPKNTCAEEAGQNQRLGTVSGIQGYLGAFPETYTSLAQS